MCRLKSLSRLTCLNPLYIVRISDFVNLVSFRRSFSCTVFLFFWASLSATAAWMSMPNSKETLSGSISPIFLFFLLTAEQHCVFFTKFVYCLVQLIRTSSLNNQFKQSNFVCLLFKFIFKSKCFQLRSKYTRKYKNDCLYQIKITTLGSSFNWWNSIWCFVNLLFIWAERTINLFSDRLHK